MPAEEKIICLSDRQNAGRWNRPERLLLLSWWLCARWCSSLQQYEKVEMEKFRGKSNCGEIYPLFPKVFVEYFVQERKAANNWLQFIVSEQTPGVLEYPGRVSVEPGTPQNTPEHPGTSPEHPRNTTGTSHNTAEHPRNSQDYPGREVLHGSKFGHITTQSNHGVRMRRAARQHLQGWFKMVDGSPFTIMTE